MLKKKITSIIAVLTILLLGTITNAGKVQTIGLDTAPSIYDNNMELTFLKNGNITTNYLGTTKKVLAFNGNSIRRRTNNYVPYINSTNFQGYYQKYYSCDEITDIGRTPTTVNCTESNINAGNNTQYQVIFRNFLQKVYAGDYVYYSYNDTKGSSANGTFWTYQADVCFSSSEIGKSICFLYFDCRNYQGNCDSNINRPKGEIGNSQNTIYTFGTIPDGAIANSPGTLIEGGTINNTARNQNCPTVQQLINNFGSSYNTGLCYTTVYNISTGGIENLGQKSIFNLFNTREDYKQAVNIYNQYDQAPYETSYKMQKYQEAFGENTNRILNIIRNNLQVQKDITKDGLRTYCHYQLNIQDKNATTCVLNTGTQQPVPTEDMTSFGAIGQIIGNTYNPATPTTNNNSTTNNNQTVYNQIINNNNNNGSGSTNSWTTVLNIFDHINSIYAKFTGIFSGRIGHTGIIPEQITRIMLIIVLFCLF